jgi:hypothetical protein
MTIKHRLYTINFAEVVIPNSLNDSTLVKFLQSIAVVGQESYRLHDGIGVSHFDLESVVLEAEESLQDWVTSKEVKDFFTECVKIKVDEFVFVNFK